jgi:hypothetical protein
MTTINSKFIPLSTIQEQFWDKLTDAPMAAGTLTFYSDISRTVLKDVYAITGTAPDYTYVSIGSSITLSSIGTIDDSLGNNLVPYLYPYEGVPDDNSSNVELYYIVVTNSGAQFQFDVPAMPYMIDSSNPSNLFSNNYVPNGQFLLHRDLLNNGLIDATSTVVAYGGWEFTRETNTSEDYVTFPRFSAPIANPTGNPRYACDVRCKTPNTSDTTPKVLQLKFNDVNKFSDFSTSDPQTYTFFFTAKSNLTTNVPLTVKIYRYFGSGGTASVPTPIIEDIVVTPNYGSFQGSFTFGSNSGMTLGANNDDYVAIQLVLPATYPFDVSFTDFVLVAGEETITAYPITTDGEMQGDTFGASLPPPNPDGSDIGLPIILYKDKWGYDYSQVGKINACVYATAGNNEVLCDGSNYDTSTVNSIGIPYSRIRDATFNYTYNLPMFGTGIDFFTALISVGSSSHAILSTNANAVGGALTAEGTIPTGFTFSPAFTGATNYMFRSAIDYNGNIYASCITAGAPADAPVTGTSGFTVSTFKEGVSGTNAITYISDHVATSLAGLYFKICNTTTKYYVWFTVDGAGSDPAIGSPWVGIKIDLLSTHNDSDHQRIISSVLSGCRVTDIEFLAASAITAGAWFKMYNPSNALYYVWYQKAGVGTDPAVGGAVKGIKVSLTGTETAAQVALATQLAINSAMWAAPDLRGVFLRGLQTSVTSVNDLDVLTRTAFFQNFAGNYIGSMQTTQNLIHSHSISISPMSGTADGSNSGYWQNSSTGATGNTGGNQSNPINMYVNYVIKI